tara:strand:- start:24382 stop:24573 length:192 start_codon:yes stop_codon:yes gene_type:complete
MADAVEDIQKTMTNKIASKMTCKSEFFLNLSKKDKATPFLKNTFENYLFLFTFYTFKFSSLAQ